MDNKIIIGVSGEAGSFSEEAAQLYSARNSLAATFKYLIDMEGVLSAVEMGSVNIGIFPVVNNIGGLVRMAFDAMGKHHFSVIDELWLNVNQCLLTLPGIQKDQIRQIFSHPQGLAQCRQYLKKHFEKVEQIPWQDTAKAAKELASAELPKDSAVIAPAMSAQLYGLSILDQNIQDSNPNLTAFVIVKK